MEHAQQLEPILPPPPPLPGTHPLTKQKIGEEITVRANETWNHAHPHASLPLADEIEGALLFAFCFLERGGPRCR